MRKDNVYRFNLQFKARTEVDFRVGEVLEKLGHAKSAFIVGVLSDYILQHPDLTQAEIENSVRERYLTQRLALEEMIRNYVSNHITNIDISHENIDAPSIPDDMDSDISQMLDNLDIFG